MDFDLLADYVHDDHQAPSEELLSNLPDSRLTNVPHIPGPTASMGTDLPTLSPTQLPIDPNQAGAVINKLEDIFDSIANCVLSEGKELTIQLRSRPRRPSSRINDPSLSRRPRAEMRSITFPSRLPQEAWRFTALLRILELSHEALVSGVVTTKRDIYYRDPELFVKQAVVDRYVDDIAYTLGVERDALNVVAAAKGLVAGSFSVTRKDESRFDYSLESEGVLIPSTKDIGSIGFVDVRWILVIEKEATFRTLATSQYWKYSLAGKGVLITAKGYPDIQTRQFLRLLTTLHPTIPIFDLVDFDPDGIGITSTYKHGSINLAHERNLAVPSIIWLGIKSSDILKSDSSSLPGEERSKDPSGILKLTARDRRIATKMLEKENVFGEEGSENEWRREVQVMLMLNVKAEIQILGNSERLGRWLDSKLVGFVG